VKGDNVWLMLGRNAMPISSNSNWLIAVYKDDGFVALASAWSRTLVCKISTYGNDGDRGFMALAKPPEHQGLQQINLVANGNFH
jgi:hypothetical protein